MTNYPEPQKIAAQHVLKAIQNPIEWDNSALTTWVHTHTTEQIITLIGATITLQADLARKHYKAGAEGVYRRIIHNYEEAE